MKWLKFVKPEKVFEWVKDNDLNVARAGAILGITSVIMTTITTVRKYDEIDSRRDLDKKEVIFKKGVATLPMIITVGGTVASMCYVERWHTKRYDVLLSTLNSVRNHYQEYTDTTKRMYGYLGEQIVLSNMYKKADGREILLDPDDPEEYLFYCTKTDQYFETRMATLIRAELEINRELVLHGFVTINQYCEFLNIKPVLNGDDSGWSLDDLYENGYPWVDFKIQLSRLSGGNDVFIISYDTPITER